MTVRLSERRRRRHRVACWLEKPDFKETKDLFSAFGQRSYRAYAKQVSGAAAVELPVCCAV